MTAQDVLDAIASKTFPMADLSIIRQTINQVLNASRKAAIEKRKATQKRRLHQMRWERDEIVRLRAQGLTHYEIHLRLGLGVSKISKIAKGIKKGSYT